MEGEYDVIVVGGGHAGCEAAMAAANLGSSVLLITMDFNGLARMSCNPAVGGIAKGQIVREIDALGGYTGLITDKATLQFRMLNKSKGPAMWSPRAQCDKTYFSFYWRRTIESSCNIRVYIDLCSSFVFEGNRISGVCTRTGAIFKSRTVVMSSGTFLNGKIFIGRHSFEGGRIGESSSYGLTAQLAERGVRTERMKTGTPPRIDIRTVDISVSAVQVGDRQPDRFSFLPVLSKVQDGSPQLPCYIFHTNKMVHEVLKSGFSESPMFTGMINGRGPRYCPSIEDKLNIFPDRDSHQLFLEPEGRNTCEYYLQGFSSSLPLQVQIAALHAIEGFEKAEIFRPAYAVEYDYFDPIQLRPTLESRVIENLFLAGQVNGTTGYEEAAAQGIIAGINASLKCNDREPFVLRRNQGYIGVLIDDLITKGVDEPYRMFTSRAEFRILLRQDNADIRLTPLSHSIGLASEERYSLTEKKYEQVSAVIDFTEATNIRAEQANSYLESVYSAPIFGSRRISELVSRPDVALSEVLKYVPHGTKVKGGVAEITDPKVIEASEIYLKYKGYIQREENMAEKISKLENLSIPENFDFSKVSGLSIECRQKFDKYRPTTIAQASRISGVSPSDISILLVYFKR